MSKGRSKLNCWEFKKCGRQPLGHNVGVLGLCPATTEKRLDGIHDGENAGRACWIVAGTLCDGEVQGSFARKYDNCKQCDFYKKVQDEEGTGFELSVTLIAKLKGDEASV